MAFSSLEFCAHMSVRRKWRAVEQGGWGWIVDRSLDGWVGDGAGGGVCKGGSASHGAHLRHTSTQCAHGPTNGTPLHNGPTYGTPRKHCAAPLCRRPPQWQVVRPTPATACATPSHAPTPCPSPPHPSPLELPGCALLSFQLWGMLCCNHIDIHPPSLAPLTYTGGPRAGSGAAAHTLLETKQGQ